MKQQTLNRALILLLALSLALSALLTGCASLLPASKTGAEAQTLPLTTAAETAASEGIGTEPFEELPVSTEETTATPEPVETEAELPEETEPDTALFDGTLPAGCDYSEAFRYALCCEYYCLSWDWPYRLNHEQSSGNFYLGDLNGDSVPELLSDSFDMDGINFLLYSFRDGALLASYETFNRSSWDGVVKSTNTILVQPDCWCVCNVGKTKMYIEESVESEDEGKILLERGLQTAYWGPDYVELPDSGSMSKAEEAEFTVEYTLYACYREDYELPFAEDAVPYLLKFRDTASGDAYFMDQNGYITEQEYLALEQKLLARSACEVLLGVDEQLFPQLPQVKLERMDIFALADALGGLDDRPEWAYAKKILESHRP